MRTLCTVLITYVETNLNKNRCIRLIPSLTHSNFSYQLQDLLIRSRCPFHETSCFWPLQPYLGLAWMLRVKLTIRFGGKKKSPSPCQVGNDPLVFCLSSSMGHNLEGPMLVHNLDFLCKSGTVGPSGHIFSNKFPDNAEAKELLVSLVSPTLFQRHTEVLEAFGEFVLKILVCCRASGQCLKECWEGTEQVSFRTILDLTSGTQFPCSPRDGLGGPFQSCIPKDHPALTHLVKESHKSSWWLPTCQT